MPNPDEHSILNCPHGKFFLFCVQCANLRQDVGTEDRLEPLFLAVCVFERPPKDGFTAFETQIFDALLRAPGCRGLTFAERMAVLEAMREGALLMLSKIEENK